MRLAYDDIIQDLENLKLEIDKVLYNLRRQNEKCEGNVCKRGL